MRYRYFRPASRLFAGRPVPSRSSDALHARFSQVVFCDLHSRLGSQSGRSYSQTSAPKPPQKSTKTDTRRSVDVPVTPSGRGPDTHPRDSRDRSTRPLPAHDQQASQSSSGTAFSLSGGGGNLPGGSGSDNLFPSTTSPLLGAALTTIIGLGLGALCFILLISDIMSWPASICLWPRQRLCR
jgi:hypothetical protein